MDIHKSDIEDLKKRVAKGNYSKYLREVRLQKVRGLSGQTIRFDFPVTALIGTNGGGKSTVLGAAAIAYKTVKPGEYFPKSNVSDNSMANWSIEFTAIDQDVPKPGTVVRSAKFGSSKWRREDVLERDVLQFPIKRTVPAGEQTKYRRFVGTKKLSAAKIEGLPEPVKQAAGRILGRDLSGYAVARRKAGDKDYILLGARAAADFSQFHFGAGEASIIEIVLAIETAKDYCLIVIEEIENGLHPIATEKIVDYLIDVAKRKKVQVVFTTHSQHALRHLPPEAIWACIDGAVRQGDLSIDSLRAITGQVDKERVVFVEDGFAKDWVEDIARQYCRDVFPTIEVHKAGGFPYVLEVAKHHNENPAIHSRACAIVDGDTVGVNLPVFAERLPGGVPEAEVWRYVSANAEKLAGMVRQRCQVPQISQEKIVEAIRAVDIEQGDIHLNFDKFGEKLDFVSELVVRRALISIYNENNGASVSAVAAKISAI